MSFHANNRYWITSIGLFALLLWITPFAPQEPTRDTHAQQADMGLMHGIAALRGDTGQACKPDRKPGPLAAATDNATQALCLSGDRFLPALAVFCLGSPSLELPQIRAPPRDLSSA